MADIPRERWTATSRRQVLRDRLEKASTAQLAAFYVEAIRALREGDDQVRFSVAGHMLRELQGGLPKHLNVPQEKGRLSDLFAWLRDTWTALIQGRAEKSGDELWRGETVDGPVARFLATLHDKIEKAAGISLRKRDEHSAMLGKLDPTLGDAPETVRGEIVTTWMSLNDIFNTATHTPTVDPEVFEKAVETFERLLEDRLVPRTVEKRDAIAAFVKEFEGRA